MAAAAPPPPPHSRAVAPSTGAAAATAPPAAPRNPMAALYLQLQLEFLQALQRREMDKAWAVSEHIMKNFPGHPNASEFQAIVKLKLSQDEARAAAKAARGGAASSSEEDGSAEEEEDEEAAIEALDPPRGGAVAAVRHVAAGVPLPAPKGAAAGSSDEGGESDDDGDDTFGAASDAEIARQLEKMGILQRASAAARTGPKP